MSRRTLAAAFSCGESHAKRAREKAVELLWRISLHKSLRIGVLDMAASCGGARPIQSRGCVAFLSPLIISFESPSHAPHHPCLAGSSQPSIPKISRKRSCAQLRSRVARFLGSLTQIIKPSLQVIDSRLYQYLSLQSKTHWKALREIYMTKITVGNHPF